VALTAGVAQAQAPAGSEETLAGGASPVAGKISYQGVLKEDGIPVTGTRDMVFRLYSNSACTTQVGGDITKPDVQITNGLFSTELGVPTTHFDGQALWLRPLVEGTALGCQELLPVPYALSLKPGTVVRSGSTYGSLATLEIVSPGPPVVAFSVGLRGEGDWGVYGTSTDGIGARGTSNTGTGVYGSAGASTGETYGVYGLAQSPDGYGGRFENRATGGVAYGVYATSDSGTGIYGEGPTTGVSGYASAASGAAYGVLGRSYSTSGVGVYGLALRGGHGVYAESRATGGPGAALWAENTNDNGIAIWARAKGPDSTVVLEHKSGSGDFIRAFQTEPSDLRFRVTVDGGVYADLDYETPAADLAEMLPAVEGLEPGDVLVIGQDGLLARSTAAYDPAVVGVYSTQPGFVGGADPDGNDEGQVPLAVVGVVPVKASAENGAIAPGDLLVTAGTPGHAMRAGAGPAVGTVIGKALEPLEEGTGVIRMLVTLQ